MLGPSPRHPPSPAKLSLVMILASLLIAVAAYLLGSIPTGYLLIRVFRHQDIRTVGSGNIGATNVLRSGGKGLGAATFLLDMLKGCAAVWLGALLGGLLLPDCAGTQGSGPGRTVRRDWPHVPGVAALSRRQGRGHWIWRFSRGRAAGRAGRHLGFRAGSRHQPLCLAGFDSGRGELSGICLVPRQRATAPPFFIAVQAAVALLIIAKHHQNIRRLLGWHGNPFWIAAERKPA